MAEKKSKKEEEKYSLISNIVYIYKALFQEYGKKMYFIFAVRLCISLLTNSILIALPALTVSLIEEQKNAAEYLFIIFGMILVYISLRTLQAYVESHYDICGTITRCFGFAPDLVWKSLTMDYVDRESHENQKLFGKANEATNYGNYYGIERMYKEIPDVVSNILGLILYGGAIFVVDVRILLVLVLMLVFNIYTNKYARNYVIRTREENTEINRKMQYLSDKSVNIVSGKDARIYRMEKWFGELLESYVEKGAAWQKKVERHYYVPVASDTIFIALRDGLAYLILIRMALRGQISLAAFTLMLGVVAEFSNWMFGFVNAWNSLLDANKPVSDYRSVLAIKHSFHHGEGIKINPSEFPPEIVLKDVSFWYAEEEKPVLSHINLHIRKGEKIALVGGNGAGKTTLVKLLCGFYHPSEGEILVNGVSIEDYDIESYFEMLGVVFQDVDEVAYNLLQIVSGCIEEKADKERFWRAVKAAGLYEKVMSLPKKEYTYLMTIFDDNGIQLSGGEMQKLMLARCIYKNAPFMILDEPTAALDPIAESRMYEEYNSLTSDKTSIFISHRLASTRFCDRILFLQNGRVVEEGTHEELMEAGGRYAEIYEVQSHYYKERSADSGEVGSEDPIDMEAAYES